MDRSVCEHFVPSDLQCDKCNPKPLKEPTMLNIRIDSTENGYCIYDVNTGKSYVAVSLDGFSGPSVARVLRLIEDGYKATTWHQDTTDTAE